jgi:hypothetical protein
MNGRLGRACTKHMSRRRRVRPILLRTRVLLLSNMRRMSRRRVEGARHRVLADRNLQRHRKDRPSHLEEAGGRTEEVAPMAAAVGRRPESAEADHRVVVAGRMAEVVAAGGTEVMARAD